MKKGLGKGLGALISDKDERDESATAKREGVIEVDINKVEPNPNQPRKHFDLEALEELADSITKFGVLQPLLVKREKGFYTIIAGERRWRAARIAKLKSVPVIFKEHSDSEILQISIIENIQRADLNPIEEALSYKRLIEEFSYTQEELGEVVCKSRSLITNTLRLLNLDSRVQNFISEKKLSVGHGKVLLGIDSGDWQFELAEKAIEESFSVRQLEQHIKFLEEEKKVSPKKEKVVSANAVHFGKIEDDLKSILGTKVKIKDKNNKGKIEIDYFSADELERIIGFIRSAQ